MKTYVECCICGEMIPISEANNAEPVEIGYCCDICNVNVVIPARLKQIGINSEGTVE